MPDPAAGGPRLFRLLERCVGLAAEERREVLDRLTEQEPDLAAELSRLLARDATATGFLDESVCELLTKPPRFVGPYRLGERLGEGGNGVVFRAERIAGQPSYPVAIKILWRRPDLEEEQRVAGERDLLGVLEHPGICKMLDTGATDSGALWIAMELVEGLPIDRYCVERALPLRERLELLLAVVAAVEYAHARQLLHCDLKPSNVLVDVYGRPRLLDFGIAGRLEAGTTGSAVTAFTPGYSSPEQLRGERLGPTADVYSVGALLYHLVCDRPPFLRQSGDRDEMLRLVGQGPPPLSRVLKRAEKRRGTIRARSVRGRLEAIVERAMAPRPEDRYPSVSRLAEDLERFMRHRPVKARPATTVERLALALRRYRLAVVAGLVSILATAAIGWQALRIAGERTRAAAAARRAEAASRLLLDSLADLDPSSKVVGELSARELIERAKRRVDGRELDPDVRAELLLSIGSLFGGVGAYEPAVDALGEALRLAPEDPRILESLAVARVRVAAYDEAEGLARRAVSLREAEGSEGELLGPLSTLAWTVLRNSRNDEMRLAEAERLAARAVALAVAQGVSELERGRAERLHASVLLQIGRRDEALALAERALERLELSRAAAYELALAANDLALAEQSVGRFVAASARLRVVASDLEGILGGEHPEVAGALSNLASALVLEGRPSEANAIFEVALDRYERVLGAEHPMVLNCASSAAYALQESGALERAEVLHRRVARGLESGLGGEHPFVPVAQGFLAENLALQGRIDEAVEALSETRPPAATPDADWTSLVSASIVAFVTGLESPSSEALHELERTRRLLEERLGPHSPSARAAGSRLERYRASLSS
jgi:tetratricopeptide (TPR) repeat protein